jgi:hypothetical protein
MISFPSCQTIASVAFLFDFATNGERSDIVVTVEGVIPSRLHLNEASLKSRTADEGDDWYGWSSS